MGGHKVVCGGPIVTGSTLFCETRNWKRQPSAARVGTSRALRAPAHHRMQRRGKTEARRRPILGSGGSGGGRSGSTTAVDPAFKSGARRRAGEGNALPEEERLEDKRGISERWRVDKRRAAGQRDAACRCGMNAPDGVKTRVRKDPLGPRFVAPPARTRRSSSR